MASYFCCLALAAPPPPPLLIFTGFNMRIFSGLAGMAFANTEVVLFIYRLIMVFTDFGEGFFIHRMMFIIIDGFSPVVLN